MKKDRKKIRLKRKLKSKNYIQLNPLMPRKYSMAERERLRKFESKLLGDGKKITLKLEI